MPKRPSDSPVFANRRAAALRARGLAVTPRRVRRADPLPLPPEALATDRLAQLSELWVLSAEDQRRSPRTIAERRDCRAKLLWFLQREQAPVCSTGELRAFLRYIALPPTADTPRWGNPAHAANRRPVSNTTLTAWHRNLSCLFSFLQQEGEIPLSPMARIPRPGAPPPLIETFTPEQFHLLLKAARQSYFPARNVALLWFLLDTGARASEVAGLLACDVDFEHRRAYVTGKGAKRRILPLGRKTVRALWTYQRDLPTEPTHFFVAGQGPLCHEALTPNGLFQVIQRLGQVAGLSGVRCSPHTFRHTFAVTFLRNGGDALQLQAILGHESLEMVKRYVRLAQADIEAAHRKASPADHFRLP